MNASLKEILRTAIRGRGHLESTFDSYWFWVKLMFGVVAGAFSPADVPTEALEWRAPRMTLEGMPSHLLGGPEQ